jgi:hypothetical protein
MTEIAGILIPSDSHFFLGMVALHVLFALVCVGTGIVAMVSKKGRGRHSRFGNIYYWSLLLVFVSATGLASVRWAQDYPLAILGALSFAAALLGRRAIQRPGRLWTSTHIVGMGSSYVLLLIAFYVDNGKNLPLWRDLPSICYWLIPCLIGTPITVRSLRWYWKPENAPRS